MNWNRFESRLIFTANLVAQTGLRVGAAGQAAEPVATDLPVMKDSRERPFIPGSSLRGALRSHVERIVRALEPQAGAGKGACNPLALSDENADHACVTDKQKKDWGKSIAAENTDAMAQKVWDHSCRICRVFGSPWLASRVRLTDLTCVNGAHTEVRDGVSINREKETVEQKYDFETVPTGSRFALEIVAENLDELERGLLWLGIEELRRGQILVGGFKGRGLGRVSLEDERLRLVEGKDGLRAYLLSGELPMLSTDKAEAWLENFVNSLTTGGVVHVASDALKQ